MDTLPIGQVLICIKIALAPAFTNLYKQAKIALGVYVCS